MPITVDQRMQVFDQAEFGAVAYEVVEQALAVHNEFGRKPRLVDQCERLLA